MNNCEESYANEGSGASWQICLLLPTLNRKNETRNGYFIRIRHLSPLARPWRTSVQEGFCKAANVAVVIVERRK